MTYRGGGNCSVWSNFGEIKKIVDRVDLPKELDEAVSYFHSKFHQRKKICLHYDELVSIDLLEEKLTYQQMTQKNGITSLFQDVQIQSTQVKFHAVNQEFWGSWENSKSSCKSI